MSTVSIFSSALIALAVVNPGFTSPDVEVNDSGIWVTRSDKLLVGRFNYSAQDVDAIFSSGVADVEIDQDGDSVLLEDRASATITAVDPALVAPDSPIRLPEGSVVAMGGAVVAVFDGESGTLWAMPFEDVSAFSVESTPPVIEDLEGEGAVAVGLDGTVYLATTADEALHVVPMPDGVPGDPHARALDGVDAESSLQVTAVGDRAVVLDRTTGVVYLPGGRATIEDAANARLQRPGPAQDVVRIATDDTLLAQPFDGGRASRSGEGGGAPPYPVVVGTCAYAAWSTSGNVHRDCPGEADDYDKTVDLPPGGGQLRFRVNRGAVVLNELAIGTVWLADQQLQEFDAWDQALAANDVDENESDSTEQSRDPLNDRDLPNRPPVAKDDTFGVRPGSSTVLPVLYNDTDPDGDVLSASLSGAEPTLGRVEPVYGGTALQLTIPPDARGSTTFVYVADDGRTGGTDTASVTVSVHDETVNGAPRTMRATTADVEERGTVDIRALDDWIDPDGDALLLTAASVDTGDEVRFRPDGLVTFVDKGLSQGVKKILVTVSDGRGGDAQGTITVTVHPRGEIAPDTKADHVSTVVDRPVTVSPLANDLDANGDTLQLARVDADDATARGARVEPNLAAGTFSFVASTPGVYYVTYLATDGLHPVLGLVRIDVAPAGGVDLPPVAVLDTALLPAEGSVLVDVLANDADPSGGVLVVQAVEYDPASGLSVTVLEHRILRIAAVRDLGSQESWLTYRVSNGISAVDGRVRVVPLPRPDVYQPPVAMADEALVRVGDVVSIPVLANDSHPDGLPFTLVRDLAAGLDEPTAGLLVTTDQALRFQAGAKPGTVHAVYEIVDSKGLRASAQVTITIRAVDAEHNSPPRPVAITARVLAGSTVRIAVPLDGVDPDGDSVRLIGLGTTPPTKGRVVAFGDGWLDYQAGNSTTGPDTFTYLVADSLGAQATGAITVGIAPPPDRNLPPIALADAVTVKGDREVSIPVLVNDTDPEGGQLQLVSGALEGPDVDLVEAQVELDRVVVRTPAEDGTYVFSYTVQDDRELRASASVTVDVRAQAPTTAPIARDDLLTLADVLREEAVVVPVLDNDVDPDGSTNALRVGLVGSPEGTSVVDDQVKVPVTETAQVVAYTITDPDGLTATAFVRVPGVAELRPTFKPGVEPLTVEAGQSIEIDIADWVVVAEGKTVRITDPEAIVTVGGTRSGGDDGRRFTFTAADGYSGPAAAAVEVVDTQQVDDPAGLRAVITVPITVTSAAVPPTFAAPVVDVEAGRDGATVDLAPFVTDPGTDDTSGLRFAVDGDVPAGFTARIDGQDLVVTVGDVATGTSRPLALSVTTASGQSAGTTATLRVVPSTAPLVTANVDVVPEARQGQEVTVRVLDNDVDPFPGAKQLDLVSASLQTAGAGSAQVAGDSVVVRPGDSFHGTMVVTYRVGDRTGDVSRQVDGRIELTVKGAPEAPLAPSIEEIRSRTVVVTWASPADNGASIIGYRVSASSGPSYSKDCASTTCILDGLQNDREYTFQVVAINEVGESSPSPSSAVARPDERPDPPAAPTLVFGDGQLIVRWTNVAYSDRSPITSVNLQISPPPASGQTEVHEVTGTEYTWDGLANGTAYMVRVQAVNKADEPSDWGTPSAPEVPAAPPDAPPAPTTTVSSFQGNAEMTISWEPPAHDNGDPVGSYTVRVFQGSTLVTFLGPLHTGITSLRGSWAVSSDPYTATVSASNKAGEGPQSSPSAPRQLVNPPGPVGTPTATDLDRAAQLAFSAAAGNGATAGQVRYQYALNGGAWNDLAADKVVRNLTNNTVYTIGVRAVSRVDGVDYVGPARSVGNVAPYGPPGTPSVSATPGTTTVRVCWSPPGRNGRDFRVETNIDNGGWADRGTSGCLDVGNGYSQTHSILARTVDAAGQVSSTASASARSQDPPQPSGWVSKGTSAVGVGPCTDSACRFLVLNVANFPAGAYTVKCWGTDTGAASVYYTLSGVSIPANGSVQTACYYGFPGRQVRLEVVGVYMTPWLTW